jgi:hypothetical protein
MRVLLPSLLLAGCAPPPYEPEIVYVEDTDGNTRVTTDTTPSIAFLTPTPETEFVGCDYIVFETKNITLVDPAAMPEPRDGYGHVHLYYPLANDQGEATGANGYEFCPSNTCLLDPLATEIVFESGGLTQVIASLRANDHSELLDDEGENIRATLDIRFIEAPCAIIGETWDTGGADTGSEGGDTL